MELSYSLSEIDIIAKKICDSLRYPIVAFNGPMGAGKTTLIKSMCKYLNFKENISSPTFSLVNEYIAKDIKIFHYDLYRVTSIKQLYEIGVDYYFEQEGLHFVEWPDKFINELPDSNFSIYFKLLDTSRLVKINHKK